MEKIFVLYCDCVIVIVFESKDIDDVFFIDKKCKVFVKGWGKFVKKKGLLLEFDEDEDEEVEFDDEDSDEFKVKGVSFVLFFSVMFECGVVFLLEIYK